MRNKFNWRSFISIGLLLSFIVMLFSGIVLYIAPEGSISRWIGWDILDISKKQWEHQHTVFSCLFICFSLLHLFINWKNFIKYFTSKRFKFIFIKEISLALIITVLVFGGTFYNWIPFKSIIHIGDALSDNHSIGVEFTSITDAEKLTMGEFANQVFDITYQQMILGLTKYDLKETTENTKVSEFCEWNKISPEQFYIDLKSKLYVEGNADSSDCF